MEPDTQLASANVAACLADASKNANTSKSLHTFFARLGPCLAKKGKGSSWDVCIPAGVDQASQCIGKPQPCFCLHHSWGNVSTSLPSAPSLPLPLTLLLLHDCCHSCCALRCQCPKGCGFCCSQHLNHGHVCDSDQALMQSEVSKLGSRG